MEALVDVLLRRNFKASKFKTLSKLAICRVAVLKKQRQVRYSQAKSDVVELLNLGHQDRALLRVEYMIKEQNLLDAFVMIENYCYLLIDRILLLKKEKECHDEVKEAIASLIFASSRCGEFPELQRIRRIFMSRFGKELATRAVELRNNCGVNPKIIQKLSVQQSSLESRLEALKQIASEKGIILHWEEDTPAAPEKNSEDNQKQKQQEIQDAEPQDKSIILTQMLDPADKKLLKSFKSRKKYRDVTAAALEAFKLAGYAADAAKAAFELSSSKSLESDQGQPDFSHSIEGSLIPYEGLDEMEGSDYSLSFEKIHPIGYLTSEPEGKDMAESNQSMHPAAVASRVKYIKELEVSNSKTGMDRIQYALTSDSERNIPSPKNQVMESYRKSNALELKCGAYDDGIKISDRSLNWISKKSKSDIMEGTSKLRGSQRTNLLEQTHPWKTRLDWKLLSRRTRKVQGDE